eukprot:TRINITY_DN18892_c0_g1_i1.p1 TRINITY_DN18892_c0_g1~~TRINITY_DN18892_c0_g1_i1.p1  ORF type:complete len:792 (-),score=110.54 TRINITY_DN18892_c0_g1_i1:38-2413(-)
MADLSGLTILREDLYQDAKDGLPVCQWRHCCDLCVLRQPLQVCTGGACTQDECCILLDEPPWFWHGTFLWYLLLDTVCCAILAAGLVFYCHNKYCAQGKALPVPHRSRKRIHTEETQDVRRLKGKFQHSAFGEREHAMSLELTSPTNGMWTALSDTQVVEVDQQVDSLRFTDGITVFEGSVDEESGYVIRGHVEHRGSRDGVFVLQLVGGGLDEASLPALRPISQPEVKSDSLASEPGAPVALAAASPSSPSALARPADGLAAEGVAEERGPASTGREVRPRAASAPRRPEDAHPRSRARSSRSSTSRRSASVGERSKEAEEAAPSPTADLARRPLRGAEVPEDKREVEAPPAVAGASRERTKRRSQKRLAKPEEPKDTDSVSVSSRGSAESERDERRHHRLLITAGDGKGERRTAPDASPSVAARDSDERRSLRRKTTPRDRDSDAGARDSDAGARGSDAGAMGASLSSAASEADTRPPHVRVTEAGKREDADAAPSCSPRSAASEPHERLSPATTDSPRTTPGAAATSPRLSVAAARAAPKSRRASRRAEPDLGSPDLEQSLRSDRVSVRKRLSKSPMVSAKRAAAPAPAREPLPELPRPQRPDEAEEEPTPPDHSPVALALAAAPSPRPHAMHSAESPRRTRKSASVAIPAPPPLDGFADRVERRHRSSISGESPRLSIPLSPSSPGATSSGSRGPPMRPPPRRASASSRSPEPGSRAEAGERDEATPSRTSAVPEEVPAAAPPAADDRPVCPYGEKCYRKNPLHFQEFRHPGREEHPQSDSDFYECV